MDTQNQPTKPVIQPPSEKTTKAATKLLLMLPVVLLLVLIAFAFGAYWAVERNGGINDKPADEIGNYIKPGENLLVPIEDNNKDITVNVNDEQVEWIPIDQQEEVPPLGELLNLYVKKAGYEGELIVNDFNIFSTKAFKLGTMKTGEYKGYSVVSQYVEDSAGMGTSWLYLVVLMPENIGGSEKPVILAKHTQFAAALLSDFKLVDIGDFMDLPPEKGYPAVDNNLTISGLEIVKEEKVTINDKSVDLFLRRVTGRFGSLTADITPEQFFSASEKVGILNKNPLYLIKVKELLYPDPTGTFVVYLLDGRLAIYSINVPAFNDVGSASLKKDNQNLDFYSNVKIGGCGFSNYLDIRSDISSSDLVLFGNVVATTFDDGYSNKKIDTKTLTVYEPKDWNADYVQEVFQSWGSYDQEINTLEKFKAAHSLLYWQDSLGRWIQLTSRTVAPLGECGKPVIYLYPQKTTDISVKLYPAGGFTVTEPDYGTGWNVTANPDGSLVNKADGQTYPYLFWEGRGGMYSSPQNFWVVEKSEVPTFLTTTLAKIGLNKQETADFMEFWVPLMQSAPYYKIGFHGTNVMDQIAPMKLSQQPDTILRILMDYEELSQPIKENPPYLGKTLERKGFTVIEWGGVLR